MFPIVPRFAPAILAALLLLAPESAFAQADRDPQRPSADLGGYRLPLLREGSAIARVAGDLTQDPDDKVWLFRPLDTETGGLRREFVLLPSPVLEDMLQTVRVSAAPVQFEVTGRVFIYRGRNFLLPDFAPTIVRFDTPAGDTPKDTDRAQPTPNGEDKFVPPEAPKPDPRNPRARRDAADDAAIEALEKKLEERVASAPQPKSTSFAKSASAQRDGTTDAAQHAPVANGTRITQRLGRLSRDPQTGSWRFVPAQVTGSGDPSIEILPCLLLERLESAAREGDAAPAILLSGTVYAYEGRSYLLPTSFRRAREGRGIGG
jgi:hypothetical protein